MKLTSHKSGQTLIEIVVVSGLLVLLLTAVISVVTTSIRRNRIAGEQAVATKLANEGVEWLRAQRDTMGWNSFYTIVDGRTTTDNPTCFCLGSSLGNIDTLSSSTCGVSNCMSNPISSGNTSYVRQLRIENVAVDQVGYGVSVQWNRGGANQDVELTGNLFKRFE